MKTNHPGTVHRNGNSHRASAGGRTIGFAVLAVVATLWPVLGNKFCQAAFSG